MLCSTNASKGSSEKLYTSGTMTTAHTSSSCELMKIHLASACEGQSKKC